MSRGESLALKIWVAMTLLAAIAMFAPGLVAFLLIPMVTLPLVMLIEMLPTLWLYVTPALLVYALLRFVPGIGRRVLKLVPSAVLAMTVAAGFIVPVLMNAESQRRAAMLLSSDSGTVPRMPDGVSIMYVSDHPLADTQCVEECQRFLFTGVARSFGVAKSGASTIPGSIASPAIIHRIVPMAQGCDNRLLRDVFADDDEVARGERRYLSEKLRQFRVKGLCFRSDPVQDVRADFVLVETASPSEPRRAENWSDLRFHRITFSRREIFRRDGDRLVPILRRTYAEYAPLKIPLMFRPPSVFDTATPGEWMRHEWVALGREEPRGMARWASNDFRVTGL